MIKKITFLFILIFFGASHAVQLGPNLLANSPSDYLIDLEVFINDEQVTQQIGNELFQRNYLDDITTYDEVVGTPVQRPLNPGYNYTFDDGLWIWIPDSLNNNGGTWYWILRQHSCYESVFINNN